MDTMQSNNIVESYWELLQNLDAATKLALIERLAQSLRADAARTNSTATTLFASGNNNSTATTGSRPAENEPFWWDALEE